MVNYDPEGIFASKMATMTDDAPALSEALAYDKKRYENLVAAGSATMADFYLIDNTEIGEVVWERSKQFSFHDRLPKDKYKEFKSRLKNRERQVEQLSKFNCEVIAEHGAEVVIDAVASEALETHRSGLYPAWHPTFLELAGRFALQNSWLGYSQDFLGTPRAKEIDKVVPSREKMHYLGINAACAIVALTAIREAAENAYPKKSREWLHSHDGFIFEIDATTSMALTDQPVHEVVETEDGGMVKTTPWVFPSPFINDTAGMNIDAVSFGLKLPERQMIVFPFDFKLRKGSAKFPTPVTSRTGVPGVRFNGFNIGAVDEQGEVVAGMHGLNIIDDANTFHTQIHPFDLTFVSEKKLVTFDNSVAHGLALAQIDCSKYII